MEGPEDLKKETIAVIIIVLFHLVGLIGLLLPQSKVLFLNLVPWHLCLMLVVVIYAHQRQGKKLFLFLLFVAPLGLLLEWTGIHTHLLFGNYTYGKTLGTKLLDVPLIMGVNWFLLIYSTGVLMEYSRLKNTLVRVIMGACLLVALDFLIEPVAVPLDYWQWRNNVIPLKNYITWMLVSMAMLYIFEKFNFRQQSRAAIVLLIAQFVFFGILNFSIA
jgi:putative membrane protein